MGTHPLDSSSSYCAAFAAATQYDIFIFYPSLEKSFEWTLISILQPESEVCCLTWAPEGCHLVSGGDHVILWSQITNKTDELFHLPIKTDKEIPQSPFSNLPTIDKLSSPQGSDVLSGTMFDLSDFTKTESCKDFRQNSHFNPRLSDNCQTLFEICWSIHSSESMTVLVEFSTDGRLFATLRKNSSEICILV